MWQGPFCSIWRSWLLHNIPIYKRLRVCEPSWLWAFVAMIQKIVEKCNQKKLIAEQGRQKGSLHFCWFLFLLHFRELIFCFWHFSTLFCEGSFFDGFLQLNDSELNFLAYIFSTEFLWGEFWWGKARFDILFCLAFSDMNALFCLFL